jgi:hypothetical protein
MSALPTLPALLVLLSVPLAAADFTEVSKPKGAALSKPAKSAELSQLDAEEQWVFEPKVGRIDAFYDREQVLKVQRELTAKGQAGLGEDNLTPAAGVGKSDQADAILLAGQEQARIEALMVQRKYEDAKNAAEKATKTLERFADIPEIARVLARIKTYHDQADDALTRNEAQAAFDALGLKIQGIMWAQSGSRLVILSGEPKALGINERVKDCVIINIDSDRVDFRFHFKRKRFEFPRYVGEDVKVVK